MPSAAEKQITAVPAHQEIPKESTAKRGPKEERQRAQLLKSRETTAKQTAKILERHYAVAMVKAADEAGDSRMMNTAAWKEKDGGVNLTSTKYDKAIEALQQLIQNHDEQDELYNEFGVDLTDARRVNLAGARQNAQNRLESIVNTLHARARHNAVRDALRPADSEATKIVPAAPRSPDAGRPRVANPDEVSFSAGEFHASEDAKEKAAAVAEARSRKLEIEAALSPAAPTKEEVMSANSRVDALKSVPGRTETAHKADWEHIQMQKKGVEQMVKGYMNRGMVTINEEGKMELHNTDSLSEKATNILYGYAQKWNQLTDLEPAVADKAIDKSAEINVGRRPEALGAQRTQFKGGSNGYMREKPMEGTAEKNAYEKAKEQLAHVQGEIKKLEGETFIATALKNGTIERDSTAGHLVKAAPKGFFNRISKAFSGGSKSLERDLKVYNQYIDDEAKYITEVDNLKGTYDSSDVKVRSTKTEEANRRTEKGVVNRRRDLDIYGA